MPNENSANHQIQWLLTEYKEMRKEIERRSKEQFICITGSIISLGSTLAFISKNPSAYSPLLIIVPWILTIFGFIWTDHAHHIFLIGSYIRERIESQLKKNQIFKENMGWQNYIQEIRKENPGKRKKPSFIVWLLPLVYFILPSVGCIITYAFLRLGKISKLPLYIEILLIVVGGILIISLFVSWNRATKAVLK